MPLKKGPLLDKEKKLNSKLSDFEESPETFDPDEYVVDFFSELSENGESRPTNR